MPIPNELSGAFRIATRAEIRSWSFGELTAPRHDSAAFASNAKGTLQDQRIFGPVRNFDCACGKYKGESFENMVCDRCGVKVTRTSARSERFGHIEFGIDVPHPLDLDCELSCLPVLPANFFHSTAGQPLLTLYDQLLESNSNGRQNDVVEYTKQIIDLLTPSVVMMHNWSFGAERNILARGMALVEL